MLLHRHLKGEKDASQMLMEGVLDTAAPKSVTNTLKRQVTAKRNSIHVIHEADETLEEEMERRGNSSMDRTLQTPRKPLVINETGFHSQTIPVPQSRHHSQQLARHLATTKNVVIED